MKLNGSYIYSELHTQNLSWFRDKGGTWRGRLSSQLYLSAAFLPLEIPGISWCQKGWIPGLIPSELKCQHLSYWEDSSDFIHETRIWM